MSNTEDASTPAGRAVTLIRTIQKYMRAVRPPAPPRGQRWHTLLRNHTVWAADFLQTYDT